MVRTAVIDRPAIDAGRRLAIISRHGVGYDAVDIGAAAERSIPVTITPLANSVSVAEHAMFMLLALAKNARRNDAAVREDRFEQAKVASGGSTSRDAICSSSASAGSEAGWRRGRWGSACVSTPATPMSIRP